MTSNKINILITDDDSTRRQKLITIFRPYGIIYRYNTYKGYIEDDLQETGLWKKPSKKPTIALHLIHAGNRENKDVCKTNYRIWYGGYGQDDTRIWENEPIIKKRVDNGGLTKEEASEIIDFIKNKLKNPTILYIASPNNDLIDRRIEFIELLGMPADFNWQKAPPKDLFQGYENHWNNFKKEALKLIKLYPDLSPSHQAYLDYAQLLTKLHKYTIEDYF